MLSMAWQTAAPLALDVRVFRGAIEVTRETNVTVFPSGTRTNGRPAPLVATRGAAGEASRWPVRPAAHPASGWQGQRHRLDDATAARRLSGRGGAGTSKCSTSTRTGAPFRSVRAGCGRRGRVHGRLDSCARTAARWRGVSRRRRLPGAGRPCRHLRRGDLRGPARPSASTTSRSGPTSPTFTASSRVTGTGSRAPGHGATGAAVPRGPYPGSCAAGVRGARLRCGTRGGPGFERSGLPAASQAPMM